MSDEPQVILPFRLGRFFTGVKVARKEPNGPWWYFRDGAGTKNRIWFGVTQEMRPGVIMVMVTFGRFCGCLGWMTDKAACKQSFKTKVTE